MKKILGWLLTVFGGFFCFVGMMCIPAAFAAEGISIAKRIFLLIVFVGVAVGCFLLCRTGVRLKSDKPAPEKKTSTPPVSPTEKLMTSQLPALYLRDRDDRHRNAYLQKLRSLGFSDEDAEKMFRFECDVIRRFEKPYLLDPRFTKNWFFGLKQPFFQVYPREQADIRQEKSLTVSELCKLIDEAEWHFWNSHEKNPPESVWTEICQWRLKGPGGDFAISYFEQIAGETGISMHQLAALSAEQGTHLSRYKWR